MNKGMGHVQACGALYGEKGEGGGGGGGAMTLLLWQYGIRWIKY